MCEDRIPHDHPFIKITKPENAPSVIITAINEDEAPQQTSQPQAHHGFEEVPHGRGGRGCRGRGRAWKQFANQVGMFARNIMGRATPNQDETENPCEDFGIFGEKRSKWS